MIVGPPGAGKSVQAQMIEDEANVTWLSTGVLLREHLASMEQDRAAMEKGELVDDAMVEDVLHKAIEEVSNGTRILIDGFPRNDTQVHWFRGYTKAARRDLEAIVHIKVPIEEAVTRLVERGRADDKEAVIRTRYKQYESEILPMLDHMAERGTRIIDINGVAEVDDIHAQIMKALKGVI